MTEIAPGDQLAVRLRSLCSIVETGRRNGRTALTAIRDVLATPTIGAAGA